MLDETDQAIDLATEIDGIGFTTTMPETTESPDTLDVAFATDHRRLQPSQRLTFGRSADLVIDSANQHLHRVLGSFWFDRDDWWLGNHGRSVTLVVVDADGGSFARVAPGTELPVPFATGAVTFAAGRANYRIEITRPERQKGPPGSPTRDDVEIEHSAMTLSAADLVFNDEQIRLLAEIARPRFAGPVTSSDIPTRRQLAADLGWSPTKLNRKLDHLCLKLDRAGVPGLVGDVTGVAEDRRVLLADLVVEHGLVPRPDPD